MSEEITSKAEAAEMQKINVEEKLKSGEWQTFDFAFSAQFDGFALDKAVVVVAAPDKKAAMAQFNYIIDQDRKQLVALIGPDGKKDVAFVNLSKASFVCLEQGDEKKCEQCEKEACECQTKDGSKQE